MEKKRNWKPILTILLVIVAFAYILPTLIGKDTKLPSWYPFDKQLNYGLDLAGGLELQYAVDYKRAIGDNTWKRAGTLRDQIIVTHLGKEDDPESVSTKEMDELRKEITLERNDYKSVRLTFSSKLSGMVEKADNDYIEKVDSRYIRDEVTSDSLLFMMKYPDAEQLKTEIINQTMETSRKRIDAFGLVEPEVRRAGDANVDVQLPGVDPNKMSLVRAMIGKPAQLVFRLLEFKEGVEGDPLKPLCQVWGSNKKSYLCAQSSEITAFQNYASERGGIAGTDDLTLMQSASPDQADTFLVARFKSTLIRFLRYLEKQRDVKRVTCEKTAKDSAAKKQCRADIPQLIDDDHMIGYEVGDINKNGSWNANDPQGTGASKHKGKKKVWYRTYYVIRNMRVPTEGGGERPVSVTGSQLTRAQVAYEQSGQPYASLEFDSQGARDFGDLTTEYTKKYLAIMLDDEVRSAPIINEPIRGGRAQVTLGAGGNSQAVTEAQALVDVLNSGAYKAPVYRVHDHVVGPKLGQQSIKMGTRALLLGSILVVFFMIFYYRVSGIIAIAALTLNVLLILAILVGMNAALTLPGIAGIVLTIGMAVDANVIIFERIREELRAGKTVRAAIDTGYSKAFWTIFDANITTALAGLILMKVATGPIYGFAVTLVAGISASMFTSIVVTRMLFNWWLSKRDPQTLSI